MNLILCIKFLHIIIMDFTIGSLYENINLLQSNLNSLDDKVKTIDYKVIELACYNLSDLNMYIYNKWIISL